MPSASTCPTCGTPLSGKMLGGLCPTCVRRVAMAEPSLPGDTVLEPRADRTPAGDWKPPAESVVATLLPAGGYTVESLIGSGGMGAVYKGTQLRLKRTVAIKLMRQDQAVDPEFRDRFLREAHTLARLNHPGIVNVIDCGEAGSDLLYIVMEFVDGANLLDGIRSGGMTQERALQILPQVCDALQFAHDHGIIHRDIKPSNILLTRDGRVKIADFGLAKPLDPQSALQTRTGTSLGTPDYAAPEQFSPGAEVDHRADIYALGVMIYQMITGKLPRGAWEPPSKACSADAAWDAIVSRALQTNPADRYSSATEVKTDVNRVGTDWKGKPRKKRTARVPIVFASSIVVFAAGGWFMWKKERPTAPVAPVATGKETPTTATKDAPFVNSLGMKFVPVPITGGPTDAKRVLFSVWETRVQDYEVFAKETQHEWPVPDFPQQPTHPAVMVNWDDAQAFCAWLTAREKKTGRLSATEAYRLPSDHEGSCSVGIGQFEDAAKPPKDKSQKLTDVFPWGKGWPPPIGAGNFAGEELQPALAAGKFRYIPKVIAGYRDGHVNTAPVGSFPPSGLGLHDMSGNVWEWCADWFDAAQTGRVIRGDTWTGSGHDAQLSSYRAAYPPDNSGPGRGFRCVPEVK